MGGRRRRPHLAGRMPPRGAAKGRLGLGQAVQRLCAQDATGAVGGALRAAGGASRDAALRHHRLRATDAVPPKARARALPHGAKDGGPRPRRPRLGAVVAPAQATRVGGAEVAGGQGGRARRTRQEAEGEPPDRPHRRRSDADRRGRRGPVHGARGGGG